jgi:hypothetical protein
MPNVLLLRVGLLTFWSPLECASRIDRIDLQQSHLAPAVVAIQFLGHGTGRKSPWFGAAHHKLRKPDPPVDGAAR